MIKSFVISAIWMGLVVATTASLLIAVWMDPLSELWMFLR